MSPANFGYKDKARPAGLVNDAERAEWQPLWDLSDQYEHPYWKELGEEAIRAGHGGGDYFVMYDFARAVAGEIDREREAKRGAAGRSRLSGAVKFRNLLRSVDRNPNTADDQPEFQNSSIDGEVTRPLSRDWLECRG